MKRSIFIFLSVFLFLIPGCNDNREDPIEISIESEEESGAEIRTEQTEETVVAYICGEVAAPGVYTLPESGRINDLIEAAGGALPGADLTRINLAQKVSDGQQVIVYAKKSESSESSEEGSGKINLNFADKEELMTLPGIGESKADAIIAYREEIGWFTSTEELMNITGIKEKMYARIAGLIEV